ncbi:MAG: 4Fe-4S binding protein, partial [Planctomycetes bacterium]|nr:4Fe-4S binding protein [Planctomycetota bacterium]
MSFFVLTALLVGLVLVAAAAWQRRLDLHHQRAAIAERAEVQDRGPAPAPLQTPRIDLTRCLGCGTCVRECPESGVLALVHGQAAVVDAAACVGHGRCVTECPVEAVTLTAAVGAGDDVPVCDDDQQAVGVDGLF